MTYQVLARKWRPHSFEAMVGQDQILRALINALDQQRLHHAYLFTGTRGVGKTTVARIVAKCLNCEAGISASPCGACSACLAIDEGRFVDLLEVDAASRTKVEDTRALLDNVQYVPTVGRFKIYLIDEVHMLSGHSFNALLKTLEEPPAHVKFLLATTDPERLPATILSRCLQFRLRSLPVTTICSHLQTIVEREQHTFDEGALKALARAARGSMRDGLSLLDQAIAYGQGHVGLEDTQLLLGTLEPTQIIDLIRALLQGDGAKAMALVSDLAAEDVDFSSILTQLQACLQQIAVAQLVPEALPETTAEREAIQTLSTTCHPELIQLYYQMALIGQRDLPLAPDPQLGFEMVLLRMLAFFPGKLKATTLIGDGSKEAPQKDKAPVNPAQVQATSPQIEATTTPAPAPINPPAQPPMSQTALSQNPAQKRDKMQVSAKAASRPLFADNAMWVACVDKLQLKGVASVLAANCVLKSATHQQVELKLDPKHGPLLNTEQTQYIERAIKNYLQRSCKLSIVLEAGEQETRAKQQNEAREQRQREAVQAIEADTYVQQLKQTFAAEVDMDSIIPVEEPE